MEMKNVSEFRTKPFMITGQGNNMLLLQLVSAPENNDEQPLCQPKDYSWKEIDKGEIVVFEVSNDIEEIHVKHGETYSVYRFDSEKYEFDILFKDISEMKEHESGKKLIKREGNWYLNNLESKLGCLLVPNFYANYNIPSLFLEDTIISDYNEDEEETAIADKSYKPFVFGTGECCIKFLDTEGCVKEDFYKDCIVNDDGYIILRKRNLQYNIYKKNNDDIPIECFDEEIKTNILGLPVVFLKNHEIYTLSMFGDVSLKNVQSIIVPASSSDTKAIRINSDDKSFYFYYESDSKKIRSEDEVITERRDLIDPANGTKLQLQKMYGFWYLNVVDTSYTFCIGEEIIPNLFIHEVSDKRKNAENEDGRKHLFDCPCELMAITKDVIYSIDYCGYGKGIDENSNPVVVLEKESFNFDIFIFENNELKGVVDKTKHVVVNGKIYAFDLKENAYIKK